MAEETTAPAEAPTEAPAAEAKAPETPAPEAPPAKGGERAPDGKFAKKAVEQADWREGLPDDLRKAADKFNLPVETLKAYSEAEKRLGRSIVKPGKDATDEEKAAYQATLRREMGISDKLDDYKVDIPTSLAEDPQTMEGIRALLGKFHELGVPASAASFAINLHQQMMEQQHAALVKEVGDAMADSEVELRREWAGDYEANDAIALSALAKYGDDSLLDLTKMSGKELAATLGNKRLGDVAAFKRLFAKIGRDTGESRTIFQQTRDGQAIADEIKALRATPEFQKRDKAMVERVDGLYKRLYGDESAAA